MLEQWISRICEADITGDIEVKQAIVREAPIGLPGQIMGLPRGDWASNALRAWQAGKLSAPSEPPATARDLKIRTIQRILKTRPAIIEVSPPSSKPAKILKIDGDQSTLDDGRIVSVDSFSLPALRDPELKEYLDLLQSIPGTMNAADAWPMVVAWDNLPEPERIAVRSELTKEQLAFWKQAKGLWMAQRGQAHAGLPTAA